MFIAVNKTATQLLYNPQNNVFKNKLCFTRLFVCVCTLRKQTSYLVREKNVVKLLMLCDCIYSDME